jgi:hypothetical protein
MMLAMKQHATSRLAKLLSVAEEKAYIADELSILFHILPVYIKDETVPFDKLLEDGKRARQSAMTMLDALTSEPHKTHHGNTMNQQIQEFFQISSHPNPEIKIVHRLDWLSWDDYKTSATNTSQIEVSTEVFIKKAREFLGRQLLSCMIGIVERTPRTQFGSIFEAVSLSGEILKVHYLIGIHFILTFHVDM